MGDTKNSVCEWGPGRREAGALELFYHNVDVKINVVRIVLKETFLKSVIEIKRVSDRIVGLKLGIQGMILKGKIEPRRSHVYLCHSILKSFIQFVILGVFSLNAKCIYIIHS